MAQTTTTTTPQRRLEGRVAIVTGGASSIGRAVCVAFAAEGARVVVTDIRPTSRDPVESVPTHELIAQHGGDAVFRTLDVTKEEDFEAVVAETVARCGRLDIMVNNAGVAIEATFDAPKPVWDMPTPAFDTSVAINGRGMFLGCKHAARQMVGQAPLAPTGSRGWIVNMASVFALRGAAFTAAYSTSKHMAAGLTRTVALDCAPFGVHVNAVAPGYVDTTLTAEQWARMPDARKDAEAKHPFGGGRFGRPEEVAPLAVLLASDEARWVHGAIWTVDGGYTAG